MIHAIILKTLLRLCYLLPLIYVLINLELKMNSNVVKDYNYYTNIYTVLNIYYIYLYDLVLLISKV